MNRERSAVLVALALALLILANAARLGYRYYTEDDPVAGVPAGVGPTTPSSIGPTEPTEPTEPSGSGTPSAPPASVLDLPARPKVVFVGDGIVSGEGGEPGSGYAARASAALGWLGSILPGGTGSGFVTEGTSGTVGERLAAARTRDDVDLVVLAAGTADSRTPSAVTDLQAAVTGVLGDLATTYPGAQVLVVGPFPTRRAVDPRLLVVDGIFTTVAADAVAPYLSPTRLGWLGASPLDYFGVNSVLTDSGQERVADQFAEAVDQLTGDAGSS